MYMRKQQSEHVCWTPPICWVDQLHKWQIHDTYHMTSQTQSKKPLKTNLTIYINNETVTLQKHTELAWCTSSSSYTKIHIPTEPCINSVTTNISQFIDFWLKQAVVLLPTYISDSTGDFLLWQHCQGVGPPWLDSSQDTGGTREQGHVHWPLPK